MNDNFLNENRFNMKKTKSPINQLKQLIKIFKKKSKNTYKKSIQVDDFEQEIQDNFANELLENEIFEEIDSCEEDAAVGIYQNGHLNIMQVFRGQRYIPVHFARTEAGTFFWTSMVGPDSDLNTHGDKNAISKHQLPELQVPSYRWAQA